MSRFAGKTVVVTGAAQGMGSSHVRGFHAEGANVVVADIQEEAGSALAEELGTHALFTPLDVTQEDAWTAAIAAAEDAFGPVSVLVNNAAIAEPRIPIEHTSLDAWRGTIEVNLIGAFLGIRTVIPSMRRGGGGSIVNISSVGGFMTMPGHTAYAASKWGMRGLTKGAALELGRDNIRVNSVHPGATETPMMRKNNTSPKDIHNYAIPRLAQPEEMTRMVMFVASDDASFSTGAEFIVDGGFLLAVGTAHNAHAGYDQ